MTNDEMIKELEQFCIWARDITKDFVRLYYKFFARSSGDNTSELGIYFNYIDFEAINSLKNIIALIPHIKSLIEAKINLENKP